VEESDQKSISQNARCSSTTHSSSSSLYLSDRYWFWDPVLRLLKEFTKAGLPEIPKGTPGVHVRISNLKEHQAWTRALRNGKITFCAKVRGFDEHSVIFDDGVKADVDVVVCCTG
jgi:hypothetical protein